MLYYRYKLIRSESAPLIASIPREGDEYGVHISHIAGTIEVDEKDRLKKLLFRATRGKALTYFSDFKQESRELSGSTKLRNKTVYIVVF